jgi:hypothetical protein
MYGRAPPDGRKCETALRRASGEGKVKLLTRGHRAYRRRRIHHSLVKERTARRVRAARARVGAAQHGAKSRVH